MRQFAFDFRKDYGYDIPIHVVAEKLGEVAQEYTQKAYMRPLCVVSLLFTIDDEGKAQLFKIDPAGHFMGYKAAATGEKEQSATNHLEREFKKKPDLTYDETMRIAIKTLQNTLSAEFRSTDIEIGVVSVDQREVKVLTPEEIEIELTRIGESD
jgi:20S proteasome subunit alpha 1